MIKIHSFKDDNRELLIEMMNDFYCSPALLHPLDKEVINRLIDDILNKEYSINGLEIINDGELIGFGTYTTYYSTEVAGIVIQFEDIYIKEKYRSLGIGKQYIQSVIRNHPEAKRFRLEVAKGNLRAKKLYEKLGFIDLSYYQMVYDL